MSNSTAEAIEFSIDQIETLLNCLERSPPEHRKEYTGGMRVHLRKMREVIGNMGTKIAPTAFTQAVTVFSYEEACQYLEREYDVQFDGLPADGLSAE